MSLIQWKGIGNWDQLKIEFVGNEIIYFKAWLEAALNKIPDEPEAFKKSKQLAIAYWLKGESADARQADFTYLERARLALCLVYAHERQVYLAVMSNLDEFIYDQIEGEKLYYER